MIIKTKPYVLFYIENISELERIQIDLVSNGYQWLDGDTLDLTFVKLQHPNFPIYISNLPCAFDESESPESKMRNQFNQHNNNIIFFSNNKKDFNLKLLRKDKLIELKNNENK